MQFPGGASRPDPVARKLDMSAGTFVPAERVPKIERSIRRTDSSDGMLDLAEQSSRQNDCAGVTFVPPEHSVRLEQSIRLERSIRRIDPVDGSPERVSGVSTPAVSSKSSEETSLESVERPKLPVRVASLERDKVALPRDCATVTKKGQ